ncbi:MAG: hypothetical protein EOO18_08180 [Chryseobacterium sp.]|nr:MAG: hypothetical protein EOO18_08180 [Chryseobacterium sp.]
MSGIEIILKYKNNSKVIQGISFKQDGLTFKASALDRSLSFGKLDAYFQTQGFGKESENTMPIDWTEVAQNSWDSKVSADGPSVADMMEVLFAPTFFPDQSEPEPDPRRKKKRGVGEDENQSQGRGR